MAEAISVGDPVEWSTVADQIRQARANAASRVDAFGVATTAQAVVGQPATIVRLGIAEGVIAGATAGDRYWLGATGGLATSPPAGVGNHVVFIGTAKNATDREVKPQYIGRRGA